MSDRDMIDRDHFDAPIDPAPKRLYDLAEKAIAQGQAQRAVDVLEPIVEPKVDETAARNLGRQF